MSLTMQPLSCDQGGMQFPHRSRLGAQGGGGVATTGEFQQIESSFDGKAPTPGEGRGLTHQPLNYLSGSQLLNCLFV